MYWHACSTGISAADRARTLRVLADPVTTPGDLVRPGHVVPLRAREGGVLTRRGHTEATVDLCRLAGLAPVGAIGELTADDGTMLRTNDVLELGAQTEHLADVRVGRARLGVQVVAVVPAHREAQVADRGERGGAGSDIAEGNFLGRIEFGAGALTVPGGNRGVAVYRGTVFQNAGQGEGDIHHRGKHASTVAVSWCGRCALCVILVRDW